jgi:hypothetical protein
MHPQLEAAIVNGSRLGQVKSAIPRHLYPLQREGENGNDQLNLEYEKLFVRKEARANYFSL